MSVVLGTDGYRYEVDHGWAKLPPGMFLTGRVQQDGPRHLIVIFRDPRKRFSYAPSGRESDAGGSRVADRHVSCLHWEAA